MIRAGGKPQVLVVFAHDNPQHVQAVAELAEALRAEGFKVIGEAPVGKLWGLPRLEMYEALGSEVPILLVKSQAAYREIGAWLSEPWQSSISFLSHKFFHQPPQDHRQVAIVQLGETSCEVLPVPWHDYPVYRWPQQSDALCNHLLLPMEAVAHPKRTILANDLPDALTDFICSAFNYRELRALLIEHPEGRPWLLSLDTPSSQPQFARAVVDRFLVRRGGISWLMSALARSRPARKNELTRIAEQFNIDLSYLEARASSPFDPLMHVLNLSSGFELLPVILQDARLASELIAALTRGRWTVRHQAMGEEDWPKLLGWLDSFHPPVDRELVLIHGLSWGGPKFSRELHAVNVRRDILIPKLSRPLLWVGPRAFHAASHEAMPDMWSVRAIPQAITSHGFIGALPLHLLPPTQCNLHPNQPTLAELRKFAQNGEGPPEQVLAFAKALLHAGDPQSIDEAIVILDRCMEQPIYFANDSSGDLELLRDWIRLEQVSPDPPPAPLLADGRTDAHRGVQQSLLALYFALVQHDWYAASVRVSEAFRLLKGAGAPRELVSARLLYAAIVERMGEREEAQRSVEQAVEEARRAGQPETEGDALKALGLLAGTSGDLNRADRLFTEAAAAYRRAEQEALAREVEGWRLNRDAAP